MMRIRLLGTGTSQGIPVIGCDCKVCQSTDSKDKRLRTSAMLEWDDKRLVIDCGPDFRTQMLREHVKHIDAILFTHEHADHTAGLDDIRPLYFRQNKPVPIYALERVLQNLERRFDYIFTKENRYPGAPEVDSQVLSPYQNFEVNGMPVQSLDIRHGELPILGYIFDRKIAYITDAKTIPGKSMELLQGIDLLVINALHHRPHKMHMNLQESLAAIEQIQPKQAVLIHISHHMGLHRETAARLPQNVFLGFDGMEIEIK